MRVAKYIPGRMYGFVADPQGGQEVFFHLGTFDPGRPQSDSEVPPPPILGEEVTVTLPDVVVDTGRAPRAIRVERLHVPVLLSGVVCDFNPYHGYGFVQGSGDGVTYHLHSSEMADGHIPMVGNTVTFFAGVRQERPRACHARVKQDT